ncbi:MAG: response regulator transcription factor [Chloroflexi bacterium]|nr:response regulator transcription factor [Chloroflexota bacterium]
MEHKPLVLVVDDEPGILDIAQMYLTREGFRVAFARDGQAALDAVAQETPALVILDLMLPQIDGWQVCRQLRRASNIPIIMLTARDEDVDKIVGLELGADDYITKPFNPRELTARVKAVLRRAAASANTTAPPLVRVGSLSLDRVSHRAQVHAQPLELTPREFDLMWTLANNVGKVFEREQLLEQAWGYDFPGGTRTVDMHIAQLRRKLAAAHADDVTITTLQRVGYRLDIQT